MNCIYCGKPLYQHLSIRSLFKMNHRIHEECTKKMWTEATDYIPVGQKIMVLHPLFDYDNHGNNDLLFFFYGGIQIKSYLSHKSDVLIFVGSTDLNVLDTRVLYLVSQLATVSFYLITLYRTRLM